MIPQTYCPNCKSEKRVLALDVSNEKDSYMDYLKMDYEGVERRYFTCEACGLTYRDPVFTEEEKEKLYDRFRDIEFRGEDKNTYFERITSLPKEESENYEKCDFLAKHIPQQGNILDVGCGAGVFLWTFKNYFPDWRVLGIEPTKGFADFANSKGIRVVYGYLKEDTLEETFDLITLIHVLEHVVDFKGMLVILRKYLRPGGLLYIESPSTKDIGYLPPSHDRFMCQHEVIFSKELLEQIFIDLGYELIVSEDFISKRGRNNVRILAKLT